jgi:hypothetical protein
MKRFEKIMIRRESAAEKKRFYFTKIIYGRN